MATRGSRTRFAIDTSVAVAALDASHEAHLPCRLVAAQHRPALAGHAAFETYSVLTRLPGAARVPPETAAVLVERAFPERCWLTPDQNQDLFVRLSSMRLSGGMVYDAMVGEAARLSNRVLLTRDRRAQRTYDLIGVDVEFVAD